MINNDFENLKAILALVESRVRKEARLEVVCYFLSDKPSDPSLGYIEFTSLTEPEKPPVTHTPGIPRESLYKVLPIAQWIVRQISKDYPDWFIKD